MILDPRKHFRLSFSIEYDESEKHLVRYHITLPGKPTEIVSDLLFSLFRTLDALFNGEQTHEETSTTNECICDGTLSLHCPLHGVRDAQ